MGVKYTNDYSLGVDLQCHNLLLDANIHTINN